MKITIQKTTNNSVIVDMPEADIAEALILLADKRSRHIAQEAKVPNPSLQDEDVADMASRTFLLLANTPEIGIEWLCDFARRLTFDVITYCLDDIEVVARNLTFLSAIKKCRRENKRLSTLKKMVQMTDEDLANNFTAIVPCNHSHEHMVGYQTPE